VISFEKPLHISHRTTASLWQEYRIFPDRLELQSWFLFHIVVIPTMEILEIEVRPSIFGGSRGFIWGIKLDNCNLCRHVLLKRKHGWLKRIGFTPDHSDEFVRICRSIMPGARGGMSG